MDSRTEAQILLADYRGCSTSNGLRSFHTFNFGGYYDDTRTPFGAIRAFNDDTLKPDHRLEIPIDPSLEIILIPVVGAIEISLPGQDPEYVESGQAGKITCNELTTALVANPYPANEVNFLQIWVNSDSDNLLKLSKDHFDLQLKDRLHPVFTGDSIQVSIGMYGLRKEEEIIKEGKNLFVFVIQGAFEVQKRLLQPRDGLKLWNIQEPFEFEALSDGAILLVIEQ